MPAPRPKDGLTLEISSCSAKSEMLSDFSRKISTRSAPADLPRDNNSSICGFKFSSKVWSSKFSFFLVSNELAKFFILLWHLIDLTAYIDIKRTYFLLVLND